jgi:hypothetical protein
MYDYFPMNKSIAKRLPMYSASHSLWYSTRHTRMNVLKWWVWCALEENCMAPKESRLACRFAGDTYNLYANCHRFDQSAINMIAAIVSNYDTSLYRLSGAVLFKRRYL